MTLLGGRALPADRDDFGRLIEAHRRDLVVLCYRFLGSLTDAEDAAQETALRAWRGRSGFRAEAGVRTWLHRIATRVCLDFIDRRGRRVMPTQLGPPSDPSVPPTPPADEILWLEPLPDSYLADAELDPAARYSLAESVSLAFTTAVQALPPRQRAVLLLRDVLAWRTSEVAEFLGLTTAAVNSALGRARVRMEGRGEIIHLPTAADRHLLDAYMRAWENDDMGSLARLLREEVRLAMPPSPAWFVGPEAVVEMIGRWVMPMGPFRMRLTAANMQPAVLLLRGDVPLGVHVLAIDGGAIQVIDAFMDERVAAWF